MKKIIFDVDNTLFPSNKDYQDSLFIAFNKLNIKYQLKDYDIINAACHEYETCYDHYIIDELAAFIHERNNIFNKEVLINWCLEFTKLPVEINADTIDTLRYLSSKYELVAYSNWFTSVQELRLRNHQIDIFF